MMRERASPRLARLEKSWHVSATFEPAELGGNPVNISRSVLKDARARGLDDTTDRFGQVSAVNTPRPWTLDPGPWTRDPRSVPPGECFVSDCDANCALCKICFE